MSVDQKIIGASKNIENSDQAVNTTGFRNLDLGGNTSADGLKIRNQALTDLHEFNGVGDYRLITGRFAMGGGFTSSNYGALFNKSGSTASVGIFGTTANANALYISNTTSARCMALLSTGTGTFQTGALVSITGNGAANRGIQLDVKNASGLNYALDILSGDIKTPSGTGEGVTLNFNAPNSGDTASMTFEKGILISHTTTP